MDINTQNWAHDSKKCLIELPKTMANSHAGTGLGHMSLISMAALKDSEAIDNWSNQSDYSAVVV